MKTPEPSNLGEAIPWQMARVRDEVIPAYEECGPGGSFAVAIMKRDLDEAARALAEGDLAAMMRSYISLKNHHT